MNFWQKRRIFLAAIAFSAIVHADPTVSYLRVFPGSTPPYVKITVDQDGTLSYNESEDPDNAETLRLEASRATEIFALADRLDHFKKPLESGLKVANLGQKTLTWSDDNEKSESTFNFSMSEDARTMVSQFDAIVESARLLMEFRRVVRYDRLGVNAAVNRAAILWDAKRLSALPEYLVVLDQVAKNEAYIHMAREKAARLATAIRAAGN